MERLTAALRQSCETMAALATALRALAQSCATVARAIGRAFRPWRRWWRRHVVRDLPSHSPHWPRAARGIDCRMLSWRRRLVYPKG